ncbi:MAG: transposase [Spirosomataceae bacterium]
MKLSPVGILADVFWYEIRNHAMYVELAAFVVMPNHVHGILILDKPESIDSVEHVETGFALSLHRFRNQGKNTISSIVGSYKSAITKHCNRLGLPGDDANVFAWQTRFHDQIIRNDAEYQRINDYIESNPKNWEKDKFWVL